MENVEMANVSVDILTQFGFKILAAAVIFFMGLWIANRLVALAKKMMAKAKGRTRLRVCWAWSWFS